MIALGAILKYAVTWTVSGIDLRAVGVVLMVVGVIGLVLGIFLLTQHRRTNVAPRPPIR